MQLHNKKIDISYIQRILCYFYIIYISFAFLLCFHDNYIDLTVTKRFYYLMGSSVFCASMLFLMLCHFLFVSHNWKFSTIYLQVILLGMILFWGIGLLFSPNAYDSLWGNYYKCTGLMVYLLGTLSICFLGYHLRWTETMTWLFVLSSVIICLLQVLNRFEIDPLHMYTDLIYYEYPQFISTLGNTNYNGAFDCIIIGLLMTLFFQCTSFKKLVLYGIALCIAFAGAICTVSDVVYICIAMVFVVLIRFAFSTPIKWLRIWEMMILFTIPCGIFPYFFNNREEELFIWDITETIFRGHYFKYQVLAVFGAGVFLLLFYQLLSKYRNGFSFIYKICFITGVWALLSILILANSTLIPIDDYPLLAHFRIDGAWGNDRGDLWQRFMTLFLQAPLANKLLGYGFNSVFPALETVGLGIRAEEEIADAHNIYFNTLITSGIIGCLLWAAFIGILFYRSIRLIQQKKDQGIYVLIGLLCILVQGLVIGPQIITTPVILTEFGVFYSLVTTHPIDES